MLKSIYRALTTRHSVKFPNEPELQTYEWDDPYDPRVIELAITRVNSGMAALDKQIPDWEERINLAQLEMCDGSVCIVGQTMDGYDTQKVAFIGQLVASDDTIEELSRVKYNDSLPLPVQLAARDSLRNIFDQADQASKELAFMDDWDSGIDFPLLDVVWVSALRQRIRRPKSFLSVPR